MDQVGLPEFGEHQRDSADLVEVGHHELPPGFHVGDHGGLLADGFKVVVGEFDLRLGSQPHEVEHGVGGSAHGLQQSNGVEQGFTGHDVAGKNSFLQHGEQSFPGPAGEGLALTGDRRGAGAAGQGQPDRLADGGHGVGREHAGAGSGVGAGPVLDPGQFGFVDFAGGVGSHRLEHVLDVDVLAVVTTRVDGSTVHEHRGQVGPQHGHHHAGEAFVAAADADEAVVLVGVDHQFHGVGDDLPADEGGFHALVTHGDAVADGDRGELPRCSLGFPDAFLGVIPQFPEVKVAGGGFVAAGGHAQDGLAQVVVVQPHRLVVGPGRGPVGSFHGPSAAKLIGVVALSRGHRIIPPECGEIRSGLPPDGASLGSQSLKRVRSPLNRPPGVGPPIRTTGIPDGVHGNQGVVRGVL